MKKSDQKLATASLLDAFGDSVRELRNECNRVASISMARFILLTGGLIVALLLRYWLV